MIRSKWIASICIVLAALGLALGYTLAGEEVLAPAFTILGILWLISLHRQWKGINSLALILIVIAAGYAVLKSYSAGLMLFVLVSAISTWDLDSTMERFRQVKPEALQPGIENRHLLRLALVDAVGLLLGAIALIIRIRFSLGIGLILGLVLIMGISQIVLYLRRT